MQIDRASIALIGSAVALTLAFSVAGCGSDSSSGDAGTTAPSAKSVPATETTASPTTTKSGGTEAPDPVAVDMKDIAFSPVSIDVKVGQEVIWTNLDSVDHDVVATEGATFRSDVFGQDGTFAWTALKPGKIKYTCTLHPGMDGTLNVTG